MPLRLRPASNPEKKLVAPDENFEAYDYSQADYSEFKPAESSANNNKLGKVSIH